MASYRIYQIDRCSEDFRIVNKLGWDEASKVSLLVRAHLEMTFNQNWNNSFLDAYKHVATMVIEEDDLERVFAIGNGAVLREHEIFHRKGPMASISVGDLIKDDKEDMYVVADIGFKKIEA